MDPDPNLPSCTASSGSLDLGPRLTDVRKTDSMALVSSGLSPGPWFSFIAAHSFTSFRVNSCELLLSWGLPVFSVLWSEMKACRLHGWLCVFGILLYKSSVHRPSLWCTVVELIYFLKEEIVVGS